MVIKSVRIAVAAAFVLVLVATLWRQWGTSKGNTLVDESNALASEANSLAEQAGVKYKELFSEANLAGLPGNRERLKALAQETADLAGKSARQYRASAAKLEEATAQLVDSTVVDYWSLKVKAYQKFADSKDAFARVALALLDTTIQDADQLGEKLSSLTDEALALDKEHAELAARADRLKAQHSDKFRK